MCKTVPQIKNEIVEPTCRGFGVSLTKKIILNYQNFVQFILVAVQDSLRPFNYPSI